MIIEELYGKEMLNELQLLTYDGYIDLLRPIDERLIDTYHTSTMVRHRQSDYYLDCVLTPRNADMVRLHLEIHADSIQVNLDGWQASYSRDDLGLSQVDLASTITRMIRELFFGRIKIVEQRAGGQGYHWTRYDLLDDAWVLQSSKQAWFFNYFGTRTNLEKYCRLYP